MGREWRIGSAVEWCALGMVLLLTAPGCGADGGATVVPEDMLDVDSSEDSYGDAAGEVLTDSLSDGQGKPDATEEIDDGRVDAGDILLQCVPACDASKHLVCDQASGTCVCDEGFCDIDGQCVADGALSDGLCQRCDVEADPGQWTTLPAGALCRPSAGVCDPVEVCDGTSEACPDDFFSTSGPCDDADPCTHTDECKADKNCSGTAYECSTPGYCETSAGAECDGTGGCVYPASVGEPCDDQTDCTRNDKCDADKACIGEPFECSPGECRLSSVCNGVDCTFEAKDDGTLCGTDDQCLAGNCVDCADLSGCVDFTEDDSPCTDLACEDGTCVNKANDENPCDDGNICTFDDNCVQGSCLGTAFVCGPNAVCDGMGGCDCLDGYQGDSCDECAQGWTGTFPDCLPCDLDGDGYLATGDLCGGDDCDDDNYAVNPGAHDNPDPEFLDLDCDGYDGSLRRAILVSKFGADSLDCGAVANPCATLAMARYRTMITGRRQIWVQVGVYGEGPAPLGPVDQGLGFYGGYDLTWQRLVNGQGLPGLDTEVGSNGDFVFGIYGTTGITVANMTLKGRNATGKMKNGITGKSSTVIRSVDSEVVLQGLDVVQGNGAPGGAGADSPVGSSGGTGGQGAAPIYWFDPCSAGNGWAANGAAGGSSACRPGGSGGQGGSVYCGFMGVNLFNSGSKGGGVCGDEQCQWGSEGGAGGIAGGDTPGKVGGAGQHGTNGQGGAGGAGGIVDQYGHFIGTSGVAGGKGTDGIGGGGGGGGAGRSDWVVVLLSYAGGAGAGGGGGGCTPTVAAGGGGAGGSSVGMLAINSVVDMEGVEFVRGAGGAGGAGGKGAAGGAGGAGGTVLHPDGRGGQGGAGGQGGNGGASGGGGGGAGGNSVAVYSVGSTLNLSESVEFTGGTAGAAGPGGTNSGTNSGTAGTAGIVGDVEETTMPVKVTIPSGGKPAPACDPELEECPCGPDFYDADGACITRGFVPLPVGTFTMGSPASELGRVSSTTWLPDPELQHDVMLTYEVEMQSHEVTQLEWAAAFDMDPSLFGPDWRDFMPLPQCGHALCPLNGVSWFEAVAYANWLSQQRGLTPCYLLSDCEGTPGERSSSGGFGSSYRCTVTLNDVVVPQQCEGYRLPTEAEWEWAARAGTTTAWFGGNLSSATSDHTLNEAAWTNSNTEASVISTLAIHHVHPVMNRKSSPWGLFDTSGNVAEWTGDYASQYSMFMVDPAITSAQGGLPETLRMARGGGSSEEASKCRSAVRLSGTADVGAAMAGDNVLSGLASLTGFRLVRTIHNN